MSDPLLTSVDNRGVATLLLNRPDKHNALSSTLITALTDAAVEMAGNDKVRVVVLAGTGKSFCAGGDLRWMQAQMMADRDTRETEARKIATMLGALNSMPKPVIARVHGNAFGGGVGLACVADAAIGVREGAKFGLTETRLGLIPATIGPYVLARLGPARARRVFMSPRLFSAEEAVRLGILARAVDPIDLDDALEAEIKPYLDAAPGAVAEAKRLARTLLPGINHEAVEMSIAALIERWESEEAHQGLAAFFEKKKAPWAR